MGARAGIVVTGTEVLTGRVVDRNGPWLAERLRELGVDVGRTVVVGDRRSDLAAALRFQLADHDLVLTSGGLGPTADDLTAEVVAQVQGRTLHLDADLAEQIGTRTADPDAARKQALVPDGANVLPPIGTAPGLVVPGPGAPVVVLPGPPGELQPMWPAALATDAVRAVLARAEELRQAEVRIWGPREPELAALIRAHEQAHGSLEDAGLEVTTCVRDGELEVVTRYRPAAADAYERLHRALHEGFGAQVYADDGRGLDEVVADLLLARRATIATAESCTAGLLAGRLADRAGSSAYLVGGFVTYANGAKTAELGVPASLLEEHGAVSRQVAEAMARGARERLGTTLGVGVTGIAGPGGGSPQKPVGLVHVAVDADGVVHHRELRLRGDRGVVRRRSVVAALHLMRTALERPGTMEG